MFSDTIAFTDLHGTLDYTLTRINQDLYSSEYLYKATTFEIRLTIKNITYSDKKQGGRLTDRHTVQLTEFVYPVSPALYGTVRKCYTVIENAQGDDPANSREIALGLSAWLSASSGANITKMVNFES